MKAWSTILAASCVRAAASPASSSGTTWVGGGNAGAQVTVNIATGCYTLAVHGTPWLKSTTSIAPAAGCVGLRVDGIYYSSSADANTPAPPKQTNGSSPTSPRASPSLVLVNHAAGTDTDWLGPYSYLALHWTTSPSPSSPSSPPPRLTAQMKPIWTTQFKAYANTSQTGGSAIVFAQEFLQPINFCTTTTSSGGSRYADDKTCTWAKPGSHFPTFDSSAALGDQLGLATYHANGWPLAARGLKGLAALKPVPGSAIQDPDLAFYGVRHTSAYLRGLLGRTPVGSCGHESRLG